MHVTSRDINTPPPPTEWYTVRHQLMNLHGSQSWQFTLGVPLGVVHTRGLDKGTTTCIPQNSLTLLKILCAPRVPPTYSYPLATAAISTVSIDFPFLEWQSWNHTVCSLVRLASFAEYYALKAPPCLPGLNSSFIIFLPSEELLTFLASRYADNRFLGFLFAWGLYFSLTFEGSFPSV